jgi:hypothetical protein
MKTAEGRLKALASTVKIEESPYNVKGIQWSLRSVRVSLFLIRRFFLIYIGLVIAEKSVNIYCSPGGKVMNGVETIET